MIIPVDEPMRVHIGRVGENAARTIKFNVSEILETIPNPTFGFLNKRPGDDSAYPVSPAYIRLEGNYLLWTVMSGDVASEGNGMCQILGIQDGVIMKTQTYYTEVEDSLDHDSVPPEPWTEWTVQIVESAAIVNTAYEEWTNMTAVAEELPVGSHASAHYENGVLTIGIPKMDTGAAAIIDDTAGRGDTDKAYSADKIVRELDGKADKRNTVITGSLSMGRKANTTVGYNSVATGNDVVASGNCSHAEGAGGEASYNTVINHSTVRISFDSGATGAYSHTEGDRTLASGADAHAEGQYSRALQDGAHAEGYATTASGEAAHAEGAFSKATGDYSHAEGAGSESSGEYSHAEGESTVASGNDGSHAEGSATIAAGESSHAEGHYTYSSGLASHTEGIGEYENSAYGAQGKADHAEGYKTVANSGDDADCYGAHAEGHTTSATACGAHSEGYDSTASGIASHAEGVQSESSGQRSHAEGSITVASGFASHAEGVGGNFTNDGGQRVSGAANNSAHSEGDRTRADGEAAHSEGKFTYASGNRAHAENLSTRAAGDNSHAEGESTKTTGQSSHAEGLYTMASGLASHAEGYGETYTKDGVTIVSSASGQAAHSEGFQTVASGPRSHAEGFRTTASGDGSHVEGNATSASGAGSHAEGEGTVASEASAHAEGDSTTAAGESSHAEGYSTRANGSSSHTEGSFTLAQASSAHAEGVHTEAGESGSHAEGYATLADASYAHAEGVYTTASGYATHAEGGYSVASWRYAHAEGQECVASKQAAHAEGYRSQATWNGNHAEGYQTTASGTYGAHSEGNDTVASGQSAHAEGYACTASGDYSHAEGDETSATQHSAHAEGNHSQATGYYGAHAEGTYTTASGNGSHSEGEYSTASGEASHAEGSSTTASGDYSHAEGYIATASGQYTHAEGYCSTAYGDYSHAEGYFATALGEYTHSEGEYSTASGPGSHAEGCGSDASGDYSHAEGIYTTASGFAAHAEGSYTSASGDYSHSEGDATVASGQYSHAGGAYTEAKGNGSHAHGYHTIANCCTYLIPQTAFGAYNVETPIRDVVTGPDTAVEWQPNVEIAPGRDILKHTENGTITYYMAHNNVPKYLEPGNVYCGNIWQPYTPEDGEDASLIPDWVGTNTYAVGDKVKHTAPPPYYVGVEYWVCITAIEAPYVPLTNYTFFHPVEEGSTQTLDPEECYIEIVGNGTSSDNRSNARVLDMNGNEYLAGDVYVGCNADSTGGIPLARTQDPTFTGNVIIGASGNAGQANNNSLIVGNHSSTYHGDSIAVGSYVQASGWCSYAGGSHTIVTGYYAFAHGKGLHADAAEAVFGAFNASPGGFATWTANTHYNVGDRRYNGGYNYECITENTDSTFTEAHWKQIVFGSDSVFTVGNGSDSDHRSNAMLVDVSGNIKVKGDVYVGCNADSSGGTALPRDVQVNGTSIINDGVANIPYASASEYGLVKRGRGLFNDPSTGALVVDFGDSSQIKQGTNTNAVMSVFKQHESVFYGLAKVAGVDLASQTVTLGQYPDAAKIAIQHMFGVEDAVTFVEAVSGSTPTITGVPNVKYECGELTSLTLTAPASGTIDVWFMTGNTPTMLTTTGVIFPAWFDPTDLEANTVYELVITDGYGGVSTWERPVTV